MLAGIRVVELGRGPLSGLAAMVLADFGAEVIWLDPADPAPPRAVWQRGKTRLAVDLVADAARLRALVIDTADVFITAMPSAALEGLGLDGEALEAAAPRLVTSYLTAFPAGDTYHALPPIEGLAAARFGRMLAFEGVARRDGPVYAALPVATHAASQSACAGILAALLRQRAQGEGRQVQTSLLRGLLAYELYQFLALETRRDQPAPSSIDPHGVMPTLNYQPVRCADGRWLQLGNLLPHLLDRFLDVAGLDVIRNDPQFVNQPWPPEVLERYRESLLAHMQTRTRDEWMRLFLADGGIAAHPYQTTEEALLDADIVANGHAVDGHDAAGMAIRQLGLLARLERTPGRVAAFGADGDWSAIESRTAPPGGRAGLVLPLAGVTVLECATIIAAPFGASLLADLGARVIKIEPAGSPGGDPFRGMLDGLGAARVNTGKESICLDLKRPEAQAIAAELAASADIFIHNYRSGVPERLGLGYETLAKRNPGLVYVSVNGYGPEGPGARRPSTHPIPGAALGGVLQQFGGVPDPGPRTLAELRDESRRLFRANDVNPDPNTSVVVATAALLGLCANRWQGVGQHVRIDMFGANAYANFERMLRPAADTGGRALDPDLLGVGPLERLYRCAQGWVFLGIDDDASWRSLRALLDEPRLAAVDTIGACTDASGMVAEVLAAWFGGRSADACEAQLVPLGIGCIRADRGLPGAQLSDDPYFARHGLVVPAMSSQFGAYRRHGPLVTLSGHGGSFPGTCAAGEHSAALLHELGRVAAQ